MNESKKNYLIELDKMTPNRYTFKEHQVNSFYEHGARELNLKYVKKDKFNLFYYHGVIIGKTNGLKSYTTSHNAFKICRDKFETEKLLREFKVPTLKSGYFKVDEKDKALDFFIENDLKKVVIKPLSLAGGKGIQLNIDAAGFSNSWDSSIQEQRNLNVVNPACIIQKYIDGYDVRLAITEGVFSSAILRVPAHVIGNSRNTIKELIEMKNNTRKQSIYFQRFLYEFDEKLNQKLKNESLTLDTVLEMGEIFFINNLGNLTAGAESIDITHLISKELIEIALRATAAIPGLSTAGVDILTEDFTSKTGYVSEVNTNANHQVHHLPYKGKIQKPFKDIIHVMLIKWKMENRRVLNSSERVIAAEIMKFKNLKEEYFNASYKIFMS